MIASRLFWLLLVTVRVAVGNPLQVGNDKPLWSTAPQSFSYSINLPNESSPALNASSENMNQRCDTLYGIYPDIGDCQDALARLQFGSTQRTFAQRATDLPDTVIALPFMLFGSKALCYIQPAIVGHAPTAHASLSQIHAAANRLILTCVADADSRGGIAINIGGDNNLGVILGTYEPDVQCMGTHTRGNSCLEILGDMPATTEVKTFGLEGQPGVEEVLPINIASPDGGCILKIFSTGVPDTVSWYQIWQAAEATFAICNRERRTGWYRSFGARGKLSLFLTAPGETPNNGSHTLELLNAPSSIITEAS